MYKVFVNDNPIIFTTEPNSGEIAQRFHYDFVNINEIIHKLKTNKIPQAILYCDDLERMWQDFTAKIKPIYAAGGLVENTKGDYLLIYRLQKWDLPKGHIETGEDDETAAIREVEEECGITSLTISHKLVTTYHIIFRNKSHHLKVVHWFKMRTTDTNVPKPQLIEDITQAVWKSKAEAAQLISASYANIQSVIKIANEN